MSSNKNHKLKIGDRVKLTGKFLKGTGQGLGSAGLNVWTVIGFWGADNRQVITNEPHPKSYLDLMYPDLTPEEREQPSIKYRSIAAGNLFKVGELTERNCP